MLYYFTVKENNFDIVDEAESVTVTVKVQLLIVVNEGVLESIPLLFNVRLAGGHLVVFDVDQLV